MNIYVRMKNINRGKLLTNCGVLNAIRSYAMQSLTKENNHIFSPGFLLLGLKRITDYNFDLLFWTYLQVMYMNLLEENKLKDVVETSNSYAQIQLYFWKYPNGIVDGNYSPFLHDLINKINHESPELILDMFKKYNLITHCTFYKAIFSANKEDQDRISKDIQENLASSIKYLNKNTTNNISSYDEVMCSISVSEHDFTYFDPTSQEPRAYPNIL